VTEESEIEVTLFVKLNVKLEARVSSEQKLVCVGDTVNERRTVKRHNYVYIHSPGGAFNVISFL